MKKIITTILTIAILASFILNVYAISPTDAQLDELKNYGIMVGDPDGNLRLEDNISRAEAVKIIISIMNMAVPKASEYAVIEPPFPDIAPGHWATGYIRLAKSLGIVEGDENGNFRPQDTVTNEEYLKMLVIALGYNPMAEQRGGFPAGYVAVAAQRGITQGFQFEVNIPAKRGDIALMTYRALDIPLMMQTGFGSQVEYSIMDGNNGTDLLTLRKELEYPNDSNLVVDRKDDEVPRFNGPEYQGKLLQIKDYQKTTDGYTFTSVGEGDSVVYVVNRNTYVYISENTIPLSAMAKGKYAQIWCRAEDKGVVEVLKIELMEFNPNVK